jgi:cobalt/nickel transport system ATP-binding protein
MVAIAGVLAMSPSVLLLDEPSSFLDPRSRRAVIRILSELPHAMVVATHDIDLALSLCGKVVILRNGRVKKEGPPKEVLEDKKLLEECGL